MDRHQWARWGTINATTALKQSTHPLISDEYTPHWTASSMKGGGYKYWKRSKIEKEKEKKKYGRGIWTGGNHDDSVLEEGRTLVFPMLEQNLWWQYNARNGACTATYWKSEKFCWYDVLLSLSILLPVFVCARPSVALAWTFAWSMVMLLRCNTVRLFVASRLLCLCFWRHSNT